LICIRFSFLIACRMAERRIDTRQRKKRRRRNGNVHEGGHDEALLVADGNARGRHAVPDVGGGHFQFHFPQAFWPLVNNGQPAVLYCFIWLYLSAAGGGPWSVDAVLKKPLNPFS